MELGTGVALHAGCRGLSLCAAVGHTQGRAGADGWQPLFNGKDLEGWTPKITGYPLGENVGNTFRVTDGVLRGVCGVSRTPACSTTLRRSTSPR